MGNSSEASITQPTFMIEDNMQIFYTELFSARGQTDRYLHSLLEIARSRLKDVLVVKSELAWNAWNEIAKTSEV